MSEGEGLALLLCPRIIDVPQPACPAALIPCQRGCGSLVWCSDAMRPSVETGAVEAVCSPCGYALVDDGTAKVADVPHPDQVAAAEGDPARAERQTERLERERMRAKIRRKGRKR